MTGRLCSKGIGFSFNNNLKKVISGQPCALEYCYRNPTLKKLPCSPFYSPQEGCILGHIEANPQGNAHLQCAKMASGSCPATFSWCDRGCCLSHLHALSAYLHHQSKSSMDWEGLIPSATAH